MADVQDKCWLDSGRNIFSKQTITFIEGWNYMDQEMGILINTFIWDEPIVYSTYEYIFSNQPVSRA